MAPGVEQLAETPADSRSQKNIPLSAVEDWLMSRRGNERITIMKLTLNKWYPGSFVFGRCSGTEAEWQYGRSSHPNVCMTFVSGPRHAANTQPNDPRGSSCSLALQVALQKFGRPTFIILSPASHFLHSCRVSASHNLSGRHRHLQHRNRPLQSSNSSNHVLPRLRPAALRS